jgi:Trypsin-like peptidase domain
VGGSLRRQRRRRSGQAVGVGAALLLGVGGCCPRSASPWDRAATITTRAELKGIVEIVDHVTHLGVCTGTVVKTVATPAGFAAYVLTAKHCVDDADHPGRWGVSTPRPGDYLSLFGTPVLDATVIYASTTTDSAPETFVDFSSTTFNWIEDWAILRVDAPEPLPVAELFRGDPTRTLEPGAPVTLPSYHDAEYSDRYGPKLEAHEHSFAWTAVPPAIVQGGHSGAPVLYDRKVIAVFSGYVSNSNWCQLVCLKKWATRLQFTSIATIREQAMAHGFDMEPAEPP